MLTSARSRLLVATVLLLGITLLLSGFAVRRVLLARVDERINQELDSERDEFEQSASQRLSATATTDSAAVEVFDDYLATNLPGEDEVLLGIVGETPYKRSANALYPVEADLGLVSMWTAVQSPQFFTSDTPEGELRSLAVPVRFRSERIGTFVVARFPAGERSEITDSLQDLAIIALCAFLGATALAWGLAGRVLAPLRLLSSTAAAISREDLTRRLDVKGSGELANLAVTFNAMVDRLEAAVASQRDFLDDAGHELRTPLTIVRGHLDVLEPERPIEPSTLRLLLDEIDRMSRIVDDLLLLASSRQPRFVVRERVDVLELLGDIAHKSASFGEREWVMDASAQGIFVLDRQRITQAWLNLTRNAVQHTHAGDRIVIGAHAQLGRLDLFVADSGEGLPPEDIERIFSRFGRSESDRRTRDDGMGLGLSIVSAIVRGHGGAVEVSANVPTGCVFTMQLPGAGIEP